MYSGFLFYRILLLSFLDRRVPGSIGKSRRHIISLSTYMNMTPGRSCMYTHAHDTYMIHMICVLVSFTVDVHLDIAFFPNFLYLAMHLSCYFLACLTK